jgi:hypothetical protein
LLSHLAHIYTTVYLKLLDVEPLACVVFPIFTEDPVCVKLATKEVRLVLPATVTVTVFPEITPVAAGVTILNVKISLEEVEVVTGVFVVVVLESVFLKLEFVNCIENNNPEIIESFP